MYDYMDVMQDEQWVYEFPMMFDWDWCWYPV